MRDEGFWPLGAVLRGMVSKPHVLREAVTRLWWSDCGKGTGEVSGGIMGDGASVPMWGSLLTASLCRVTSEPGV